MEENKKTNQGGTVAATAKTAYETKVGIEAVARSGGKNPQLKGVVHEVLYRDSITLKPENIVNGVKGTLSKSPTAVRDDVLTMQAGKVIARSQLKDTISSAGISKTVQQASSGKYAGTKLMGTKETVEAFNNNVLNSGKAVSQKITSTGISSADTSRIAAQTIGGSLKAASVAKCALNSGGAGAALSGGIEAISSGIKLAKCEIDGSEFVANVARETVGGGISAAGATAAATVVGTAAATVLASTTAPLWIPGAIAVGAAMAVGSGIKSLWDSIFF